MAMKEIIVTIPKDGNNVKVEPTQGFSGQECLKATADIEAAIGKLEKRDPKPEMYQQSESTVKVGI
jgi:hypothetical protein